MLWCNTHQRPANLCKSRGGVLLPRRTVDLTDLLEITYEDEMLDRDLDQIKRLIKATKTIVDRHAETKEGSGLLYVPVAPHEMKELRSALEPFRTWVDNDS